MLSKIQSPAANASCRLYLITPPKIEAADFAPALAAALDAGDVACVQMRLKEADDDAIRRGADVLRPICQDRGVAFIINDRPDLAVEAGCDGVHIGQEDATYAEARRLVGGDAIVGVTCHDSKDLAFEAAAAGADYVAFGAFFPTATKEAKGRPDPEILAVWREITTVPAVAVGGITVENCATLVRAGAHFLAVLSAVWNQKGDPAAAVKAFNRAIAEA